MDAAQSIPDLVAAARAEAQTLEARIVQAVSVEDVQAETAALEAVAVDIFTVFEARMQHHFKRGPFSRKLKALLLETGHTDLAERLHQHYLAINVLKHGRGASHRELLKIQKPLFAVKEAERARAGEEDQKQTGLIDVASSGFFDGLASTLTECNQFLENR